MANEDPILDPNDYTIVPHVAAVDEFVMRNDDGSFVANINEPFLDRLVARMNAREADTGDLCPLVIGHTEDGEREVDAPPVVGFARNWRKDVLFNTSRKAAFFDAWVKNACVDTVRNFPRRSCEVWPSRYEVDPISLLGATTPARDLGLLKLSRDGSFVYTSPEDMTVPDPTKTEDKKDEKKDDKPKADPAQSGASVKADSKQDQILAALQQILQLLQGGEGAGAAGAAPAPDAGAAGAPGAEPGADGQMSDEDIEKLLAEMGGQGGEGAGAGAPAPEPTPDTQSRSGEPKVKNSGSPGGDNTYVHLERENAELKVRLSRIEVAATLNDMYAAGLDVDPKDEALVSDLIAMPPDIRNRQLQIVKKLARPRLDAGGGAMLGRALDSAVSVVPGGTRRIKDRDEMIRLSRRASAEGKSFEAIAAEEGITLG